MKQFIALKRYRGSLGKKYTFIYKDDNVGKLVHFGSEGSKTYVEGASEEKKNAYISRHKVNENWNQINPGSLSRYILWGDSRSIRTNLENYKKRFNIN